MPRILQEKRAKIVAMSILLAAIIYAMYASFIWYREDRAQQSVWGEYVERFERCDLDELGYAVDDEVITRKQQVINSRLDISEIDWSKSKALYDLLLDGDDRLISLRKGNRFINPRVRWEISEKKQPGDNISLLTQCISRSKGGDVRVQFEIARYLLSARDEKSLEWLEASGEAGIPEAYIMLGHAYLAETFGIKDERRALTYYEKAARLGSLRGQYLLGAALETHDVALAYRYLALAAKRGSAAAAYRLQDRFSILGSRSDPIGQYYWNLVFRYLLVNGFVEPFRRKEYEELPPAFGENISGRPDEILFDSRLAEAQGKMLEEGIIGNDRILLQEEVQKWIKTFALKISEREAPKLEKRSQHRQAKDLSLPKWKKIQFPICAMNENNEVRGGSKIYDDVSRSIWTIVSGENNSADSTYGSAIAVSEWYMITNCHVLSDTSKIKLKKGNLVLQAVLVAADNKGDTCIVKATQKIESYITHAKPLSAISVGEQGYTLGNPQGLELTIADGIISGIRKMDGREYIQTTAPISLGSSGGALLDDHGNLLGVTTFYLNGGQAMNFAIPVEMFCHAR